MAARIAMIAITTNNSIRVNPRFIRAPPDGFYCNYPMCSASLGMHLPCRSVFFSLTHGQRSEGRTPHLEDASREWGAGRGCGEEPTRTVRMGSSVGGYFR